MFFGFVKGEGARTGRRKAIRTVLVVEDEPLVAFDNEHALEQAGYRIAATVGWPVPRYSSPSWPAIAAPAGDAVEPGAAGDDTGETAAQKSVMNHRLRSP